MKLTIGLKPFELFEGALIGRARGAQARVHDPRVSEAHALLSVRDGAWWLLALRGPLEDVDGRPLGTAVRLQPGLCLRLGAGPNVEVVSLPTVPEGGSLATDQQLWPVLEGSHVYLRGEGWAERDDYQDEEVEGVLSRDGEQGWTWQPRGGPAQRLAEGARLRAGDREWIWRMGHGTWTRGDLQLRCRGERVELVRGGAVLVLEGLIGQLVAELAREERENPGVGLSNHSLQLRLYADCLADAGGTARNRIVTLRGRTNKEAEGLVPEGLIFTREGRNRLRIDPAHIDPGAVEPAVPPLSDGRGSRHGGS